MLTIVQHVVIGVIKVLIELHLTCKGSIDNATQHRIEDDGCCHVVIWKGQEWQCTKHKQNQQLIRVDIHAPPKSKGKAGTNDFSLAL